MGQATDSPSPSSNTLVSSRPFRIYDALILIAAFAVGAAMARPQFASLLAWKARGQFPPPAHFFPNFLVDVGAIIYPVVATGTISVILLHLTPPQTRFRRLAREPGMAACLSAAVVLTLVFLQSIPLNRLYPAGWTRPHWLKDVWITTSHQCGLAVLGAWSTLAFTGLWKPSRNWIDRTGRVLGFAWIAAVAFNLGSTWWKHAFW